MTEENGNGVRLRFSTPQIIIIVMLIVTLVVTFASKADKSEVRENSTEIKLTKQKMEMQYETIIDKLESIEKRLDEGGK